MKVLHTEESEMKRGEKRREGPEKNEMLLQIRKPKISKALQNDEMKSELLH